LLAVLVGCGPSRTKPGAVSGKITYKGQPVNDAALLLYPAGGAATDPITIPVTAEGEFLITDTPPGEYKVVVQGTEGNAVPFDTRLIPPDRQAEIKEKLKGKTSPTTIPFPKKYKDPNTTDLKCQITTSNQTLNLELKD
jgi:hypothetical protein